jgi:hypothetical protein
LNFNLLEPYVSGALGVHEIIKIISKIGYNVGNSGTIFSLMSNRVQKNINRRSTGKAHCRNSIEIEIPTSKTPKESRRNLVR